MDEQIRILLVEDDADLRDSLVECLTLVGYGVKGVASGLECYRSLGESTFDIAIVDLGLPDQDGFVLAQYIRSNTAMKIIILTARSAVEDRIKGYDNGADLYLVKPVDYRELAAAINSLAERMVKFRDQRSDTGDKWFLSSENWQLVAPDGSFIALTGREFQFIKILLTTPGIPVRRENLIEHLGYGDIEYANRAMDSLVRRLRRKIETSTGFEPPIRTIHAIGYCFSGLISFS